MTVGLIAHLDNPTLADGRHLGEQAEEAGADWLGVPDAFWWRDTWVLSAEVARVTKRLAVGPLVTNPYMRHPFVTVAAIATLQELAGRRVLVGLGAGGSEIAGAARLNRGDAHRADRGARRLDPSSGRGRAVGQTQWPHLGGPLGPASDHRGRPAATGSCEPRDG